ncbi:MAG: hypothetical protein AAF900_00440 [Bacteroidota bacterium]
MKKQKNNFKFTKKHFTVCTVIFALLILLIYGIYIQNRDGKLKDANAFSYKENFPSSHYYWPKKNLERENVFEYTDPGGKFTATTTYQADDTTTIHLKRVTKNTKTGKEVTEYGALVMPNISHSREVFEVIHKSGKAHFGTEERIYTRYGTSVQQTEASIAALDSTVEDGTRFLFWSDKPKGNFKFVGIVDISRIMPNKVDDVAPSTCVCNIAYSFGAPDVIKVRGAAQYAVWAYVDVLLHFEIPDDEDNLITTKLVLSMNKENRRSSKIAKRLRFIEGTDQDKEYSYSDGDDQRTTNENMDIYVLNPQAWRAKYDNEHSDGFGVFFKACMAIVVASTIALVIYIYLYLLDNLEQQFRILSFPSFVNSL